MKQLPVWAKKLPKKVTICGRPYKINYNMRRGAGGETDDLEINVGCQRARQVILETLIHEISELTHWELSNRYVTGDELRFVMTHLDFQNHNVALVAALLDCGLLK